MKYIVFARNCFLWSLLFFVQTMQAVKPLITTELRKKNAISKGAEYFDRQQYELAINEFLLAYSNTQTFVQADAKFVYFLAYSFLQSNYDSASSQAVPYFKKALELDSVVNIMAPLSLFLIYNEREDYQEALRWLDYVPGKFPLNDKQKGMFTEWRLKTVNSIAQLDAGGVLRSNPKNVIVNLLDSAVNGVGDDYFPSLAADESILYFTSTRAGSVGGLQDGKYLEDLWFCEALPSGKWGQAQNMGRPVNIENNNGIAAITGDGQTVICCRCNEDSGWGSCDLYKAMLTGKTWSMPQNMGTLINSEEWDAQASISADGMILVWSSKRTGGLGGQDIWWSEKDLEGRWSIPKNIGAPINTEGEEHSPFIMPDGKTLYFSSNNLSPRIGRLDVYKSTRGADGVWSQPENLGYPINTEFDDRHFVLSPSGLTGYFSSNRMGGIGLGDIYSVHFPKTNQTGFVTFVGNVFDADTKLAIESEIRIEDIDNKLTVGSYSSNSATGKFVVVLIPGHNYSLTVTKKGYLFYSENFNIASNSNFKQFNKQIFLQKIKVGSKIVLNNVFFDTGKSILRKESTLEIDRLYKILVDNSAMQVEISGHTDNVGVPAANIKLSQERAAVVVQTLVAKGIAVERFNAKGYGQTLPVASNATSDGRQLNRRTEFLIIGNK